LLFIKGMKYLGLRVTGIHAATVGSRRQPRWILDAPKNRERPEIVFFAADVPLGPVFLYERYAPIAKTYIPLNGLAKGDFHAWEPVLNLLMPLPQGGDLLMREYFESAACLFERSPDGEGSRRSANIVAG
jgi:hypothetical protein